STYLERTDPVQQANGLKPQMFLRRQAVEPRYDTREGSMILKQIGERIGIGDYFPYNNMDELVAWQLEGTGFTMADFESKGFVAYGKKQIFWDRLNSIKFKTPSGKIEFKSALLEDAGFESFPAYEAVSAPPEDQFRLVVGRNALHTHCSTQNNPYLNELCSENVLWINEERAAKLGIANGAVVEIASRVGTGKMRAMVTELIHPEAVFMLHGFGHQAEKADRSYQKGVSDAVLQENITDKIGGSPALHDTFVSVRPA
ncbi:MAG: molybdopterin oxidoreductase, partial [Desulfobacteraceae bacterium]|nr:molybdopterin oxidoreductase [Desulfobacteraceae bacterium]